MNPTRKRPAAPAPAGKQPRKTLDLSLRLPPELGAELTAIAEAEGRSRAKQIEMALRQFVQSYRQRAAA
jgi:predicted transcriptional regulator